MKTPQTWDEKAEWMQRNGWSLEIYTLVSFSPDDEDVDRFAAFSEGRGRRYGKTIPDVVDQIYEWVRENYDRIITEQNVEADDRVKKINLARTAILEHIGIKEGEIPDDVKIGRIECPLCGGMRQYSMASCNGHIQSHCETKDCITWIE